MAPIKLTKRTGRAKSIGAGADGSVWVVGINPIPGGYGLWKRDGKQWKYFKASNEKTRQGVVRLAVGPSGNAWFIRKNGRIGGYTADKESRLVYRPGVAKDIAVGADDTLFVVGGRPTTGGWSVWKWSQQILKWVKVPGMGGVRVAVDPLGNPWIVTDANKIYKHTEGTWQQVDGKASAIAIGPEGSILSLGVEETQGGYKVFKLDATNEKWNFVAAGAVELSVGRNGRAYFVNKQNKVFWPNEPCPNAGKMPDSTDTPQKEVIPPYMNKQDPKEEDLPTETSKPPTTTPVRPQPARRPQPQASKPKQPRRTGTFGRFGLKREDKAGNLFDIVDKNRNGAIGIFEIYTMFSSADQDSNYSLSPDELIAWVLKNSGSICRPYRKIVKVMLEKKD